MHAGFQILADEVRILGGPPNKVNELASNDSRDLRALGQMVTEQSVKVAATTISEGSNYP